MEIAGGFIARQARGGDPATALRPQAPVVLVDRSPRIDDHAPNKCSRSASTDQHMQVGTVIDDDHRCGREGGDGHVSKYSPAFTRSR